MSFIFCCTSLVFKEYRDYYPVYEISGESMVPNYNNNEKVHVISHKEPQRFDPVVMDSGEDGLYLKRVIGLPGESIVYQNQQLYVNGEKVQDPYAYHTADFDLAEAFGISKIPEGMYFVLGDNRPVSKDSRYFGLVSIEKLKGIVSKEEDQ